MCLCDQTLHPRIQAGNLCAFLSDHPHPLPIPWAQTYFIFERRTTVRKREGRGAGLDNTTKKKRKGYDCLPKWPRRKNYRGESCTPSHIHIHILIQTRERYHHPIPCCVFFSCPTFQSRYIFILIILDRSVVFGVLLLVILGYCCRALLTSSHFIIFSMVLCCVYVEMPFYDCAQILRSKEDPEMVIGWDGRMSISESSHPLRGTGTQLCRQSIARSLFVCLKFTPSSPLFLPIMHAQTPTHSHNTSSMVQCVPQLQQQEKKIN